MKGRRVIDRSGKTFAGFGFAAIVFALAAVPAASLLTGQANAADEAHDAHAAAADPERIAKGRDLFNSWSCSACHTLADAKANGAVGPSFDGNASINEAFVTSRVTNGQGAMPAFGGQLTKEEIADLAYYLSRASVK